MSTETYDIDENGILQLWSPYANLQSDENLEASMHLHFPTGETLQVPEPITGDATRGAIYFFKAFLPLFKNGIRLDRKGRITVTPDMSTPENILLFNVFLDALPRLQVMGGTHIDTINKCLEPYGIQITADLVEPLYLAIFDVANKHNTYFDKLPDDKIERISNNYNMFNIYSTSLDPANMLQGHSSVDATTGPLKDKGNTSPSNGDLLRNTPGNIANKFTAIESNMVGKDGISIAAVGLKGFFAWTNYCNRMLNRGTEEELLRILLGKGGRGIQIGGKLYKTLANIKALNINTVQNINVLRALAGTNNDIDAAVVLSAVLSLATDNAKELLLAKLNAGTKTMGMYLYGISIGMEFDDIADLMMSPVALALTEVANSNVFAHKQGFNNFDGDIFDYFIEEKGGPWKVLNQYDIYRDENGNSITSPLLYVGDWFKDHCKEVNGMEARQDGHERSLAETLVALGMSNLSMSDKLKFVKECKSAIGLSQTYEAKKCLLLCDFITEYLKLAHVISRNLNVFNDLKTLADGAKEMKKLGALLNLNLGIKTSEADFVRQVSNFTRCIYEMKEKPKDKDIDLGGDIIDLLKFAFDDEYRARAVAKYDKVKHTVNILDVIANSPHYLTYVRALAMAKEELSQSYKFRTLFRYSKLIASKYKIPEKKVVTGLSSYINDELINGYLRYYQDKNPSAKIIIPAGNKAFTSTGALVTLNFDTPIELGTDWGNATFRMWMELEVIPNLKKGRIDPAQNNPNIRNNKFIKDMTWDLVTRTTGHNSLVIATLPINMLPRQDSDRALFDSYKFEFNKLKSFNYGYNIKTYRGNKLIIRKQKHSVVDLLTMYSMLAHHWKLGEHSLVSIFEDSQDTEFIKGYHDFVSMIDYGFLLNGDYYVSDILNLTDPRLITYVAQNDSAWLSHSKYIFAKDPDTRKRRLMKRIEEEANDEESSWDYDGYEDWMNDDFDEMQLTGPKDYSTAVDGTVDLNYFPSQRISPNLNSYEFRTEEIHVNNFGINNSQVHLVITHDNNGNISKVTIAENGRDYYNEDLLKYKISKMPISELTEIIQSLIENKQNPC